MWTKRRSLLTTSLIRATIGSRVPAAYIVRKDGTVAWKSLDAVGVRVPTGEILTELGKL